MAEDGRREEMNDCAEGDPTPREHDPTVSAGIRDGETIGMPGGSGGESMAIPESIGGYRVLGVLGEGDAGRREAFEKALGTSRSAAGG